MKTKNNTQFQALFLIIVDFVFSLLFSLKKNLFLEEQDSMKKLTRRIAKTSEFPPLWRKNTHIIARFMNQCLSFRICWSNKSRLFEYILENETNFDYLHIKKLRIHSFFGLEFKQNEWNSNRMSSRIEWEFQQFKAFSSFVEWREFQRNSYLNSIR